MNKMKRVFSIVLLLSVISISGQAFSQQRTVVINTSSVDRTIITTNPNVDIWTQLEQERIAAEKVGQEQITTGRENNNILNTRPAQKTLTDQNEQKVIKMHKEIIQLVNDLAGQSTFKSIVVDVYMNIYTSSKKEQEELLQLQQIQYVVLTYLEKKTRIYPNLENQLINASSMEDEIAIFLSYYKE